MPTAESEFALEKRRPGGVVILAILAMVFGIFMVFGGLWWLGIGFFWLFTPGTPAGYAFLYGLMWAIFGFVALVAAGGLFRLQLWAWWLLLIVGILNVITLGISSNWILLALWIIVVVYLIAVRKVFMGRPARPVTA